ncbi:MAG: hypothetical protein LBT46_06090 [Planctomycetaceae bacterium]|nr:hypothetical protein [Planctomycetaceae bacterium]
MKPHALEEIVRGDIPEILGQVTISGNRTYSDLLDSDAIIPPLPTEEKKEALRRLKHQKDGERQDKEFLKKVVSIISDNHKITFTQVDKNSYVPTVFRGCYEMIIVPFGIEAEMSPGKDEGEDWKPTPKEVYKTFEEKIEKASYDKIDLKQDFLAVFRKAIEDAASKPDKHKKINKVLFDEKYLETVGKYPPHKEYLEKDTFFWNTYQAAF